MTGCVELRYAEPLQPVPRARTVRCPQCGKPVEWTPESKLRPFCSERCKLIDFGAWASEAYRVPAVEADSTDDPNVEDDKHEALNALLFRPREAPQRDAVRAVVDRRGEIRGAQAADRVDRQARARDCRAKPVPAQRRRADVRRRRRAPDPSTAKSTSSAPARASSSRVWHDAPTSMSRGRDVAPRERGRGPVHAGEAQAARVVDANRSAARARRCARASGSELSRERVASRDRPILLAQLHERAGRRANARSARGEKGVLAEIGSRSVTP